MPALKGLLVFLLAAALPLAAAAQPYPARPIRLIVPFPAGGPADIFGRMLAQGMSADLGQQVVVENVGGVGGVLGVDRAAKSPPDGYTLALNSASTVSIAPFSMAKMPYEPGKDLALITTVVRVPEVLAVNPVLPVNTLAELVAYAKANPGKVNFGSAGAGSITHLAGELLKVEAGINIVHVPYKGAAPAVSDLLGGQVQMGIFDVPVLLSDNWYGLVGPAGTPPAILKRIHAAAISALSARELVEQYGKVSGVPMPSSREEYAVYLAQEQKKWGAVVKAIGFKAQ